MKCPHCMVAFFDETERRGIGVDVEGWWNLAIKKCPNCKKLILYLEQQELQPAEVGANLPVLQSEAFPLKEPKLVMVRPKGSARPPCPPEVPHDIKKDYAQACLVLTDSPEASAALSRRCLQHVLHEQGFKSKNNLADEIDKVIQSGKLPSGVAENIDAVRNIGNLAAHAQEGLAIGEIVPIEPEEAEWNLDVIESLFDVFYVQPSIAKQKRDALNEKLQEVGKPPMK
jgi:Domain of unknown function (DUF4145)